VTTREDDPGDLSTVAGPVSRSWLWRRLDRQGTEHASVRETVDGWELEGILATVLDDLAAAVRYLVRCDRGWRTRQVSVTLWQGGGHRALVLRADGDGNWWEADRPLAGAAGCIDVDLEVSPATNTIPIRRLALAVGASAQIEAAWLRFPSLRVDRSPQRYTRLSPAIYRYESGTFRADLDVDDEGLVLTYPGIWDRLVPGT
jgi:uncharacterized protein